MCPKRLDAESAKPGLAEHNLLIMALTLLISGAFDLKSRTSYVEITLLLLSRGHALDFERESCCH